MPRERKVKKTVAGVLWPFPGPGAVVVVDIGEDGKLTVVGGDKLRDPYDCNRILRKHAVTEIYADREDICAKALDNDLLSRTFGQYSFYDAKFWWFNAVRLKKMMVDIVFPEDCPAAVELTRLQDVWDVDFWKDYPVEFPFLAALIVVISSCSLSWL